MKKRIFNRDKYAKEKGFENYKEYLDHLAKEKGFKNYREYLDRIPKEKGFSSRYDYQNHLAQKRGFRSQHEEFVYKKGMTEKEYRIYLFEKRTGSIYTNMDTKLNNWANKKGFNDYKEYLDIITTGRGLPGIPNINDDRSKSHFIGHIAEYGISKIFKNIQGKFFTNIGYDFVCETGEKIEVKASILNALINRFTFRINCNDMADYFILIGFDNVLDLYPLNMWIIRTGEIIKDTPINNMKWLRIINNRKDTLYFQKYEKQDKLKELREICLEYNIKSGMGNNTITKAYLVEKALKMNISDLDSANIISILKEKQKKRKVDLRIPIIPAEECYRRGRIL